MLRFGLSIVIVAVLTCFAQFSPIRPISTYPTFDMPGDDVLIQDFGLLATVVVPEMSIAVATQTDDKLRPSYLTAIIAYVIAGDLISPHSPIFRLTKSVEANFWPLLMIGLAIAPYFYVWNRPERRAL
ncbi:MAG: hypothetical protein QM775_29850 [Pirellulales bacterium]